MYKIRYKKVIDSRNALGHNIGNKRTLRTEENGKQLAERQDFPSAREGQIRYKAGPTGPQIVLITP